MGPKARPEGLARNFRLRKRRDFTSFNAENSRKFVLRHFVLLLKKREVAEPRLGLTVGRFYGSATQRNKLKRRIREFFRRNKEDFAGLDVSFIAKATRKKIAAETYEAELLEDFEKAKRKARDLA